MTGLRWFVYFSYKKNGLGLSCLLGRSCPSGCEGKGARGQGKVGRGRVLGEQEGKGKDKAGGGGEESV